MTDIIFRQIVEKVNSYECIAKEKEINGVPFVEIGKDVSAEALENLIKANLE